MMKVLVTGGTGLVGQEIGKALVRAGHQVFVLSRNKRKAEMELPYPATVIEGDLLNSSLSHSAFDEVDAVIHLAGENVGDGRWTDQRKEKILHSRSHFTRHLVQSLKANKKLKVFLSSSAIGIYGSRGDESLSESSVPGDGFLAEVCKQWEAAVMELPSVRKVIFRTGVVLSPWGGALQKMLIPFRFGIGSPLGSGKQWISWIHIHDLVEIFMKALTLEGYTGVYNAVSNQPVTNQELTEGMAAELGKITGPAAPAAILKIVLGEMSEVVLGSQKVYPTKLNEREHIFKFADIHSALKDCLQYVQGNHFVHHAEQYIPLKRQQIFPFFADAKNLEEITPELLKFHVEKISTAEIQEGTLIDYRLKIHGVPVSWRTEIRQWKPNEMFVDQQLKGPYSVWHHTHQFEDLGPGTLMTDTVRYKLPLGILGWLAAGKMVQNDVQNIFSYRRKKTSQIMTDRYGGKSI